MLPPCAWRPRFSNACDGCGAALSLLADAAAAHAAMFAAQTVESDPWPPEVQVNDPAALFPFLMSIMFDGTIEIASEGSVNYLKFRAGAVDRAYLPFAATGSAVERVGKLFAPGNKMDQARFRRWSH